MRMTYFGGISYFFCINESKVKTLIVKLRLQLRKNVFSINSIVSNIDYPIFGNLSKVVETTLPPAILKGVEWKF